MAELLLMSLLAAFFVGLGLSTATRDATGPAGPREATTLTATRVWSALLQGVRTFSRLHDRRRARRPSAWAAD